MLLSPLGERMGEGVMQETVFGLTPSPNLSPKGERNMKENQPAFAFASDISTLSRSLQPASIASSARS